MLPHPNDLTYFLEVYRTRNISRASEKLGITQPSLSLSLKRLETALNTQLFVRTKSGATPTAAANALSKDVERLLQDWSKIEKRALDTMSQTKGRVTVGSHPSVALYATRGWVAEILKIHPQLEIHFDHDLSRRILEKVISFQVDLALVINPISHPDLVLRKLCDDEVTLWHTKKWDTRNSTLIFDPALNQSQLLLQQLKKKKIEFLRHITTSSLELIDQMVNYGTGVGILPRRVCRSTFEPFSNKIKPIKDELYLIYRADIAKTKAIDVVLEAIRESYNY